MTVSYSDLWLDLVNIGISVFMQTQSGRLYFYCSNVPPSGSMFDWNILQSCCYLADASNVRQENLPLLWRASHESCLQRHDHSRPKQSGSVQRHGNRFVLEMKTTFDFCLHLNYLGWAQKKCVKSHKNRKPCEKLCILSNCNVKTTNGNS